MTFAIFPEESKSLVKHYLTREIYESLRHKSTDNGFTLDKAIQSGIVNPDSAIGIYAGDAQSYQTFKPIFTPIIEAYHGISQSTKHVSDIRPVTLTDPDPDGKYILSTRIRVARNISGFCFTSHINLDSRGILEQLILKALHGLTGDLKGHYNSFSALDSDKLEQLIKDTLFFRKGDRFQDAAGINSHFPKCRGIYASEDKRFRVWINEEDHLRVISQDSSSDLQGVFNHLANGLNAIETTLQFEKDLKYGYLSSCPTNIGTAMRAGVHIRLEKLHSNQSILLALTEKHDLQIRGTLGEKTQVQNCVFDISNRRRLGISESEIVHSLHQGLLAIIAAEKKL